MDCMIYFLGLFLLLNMWCKCMLGVICIFLQLEPCGSIALFCIPIMSLFWPRCCHYMRLKLDYKSFDITISGRFKARTPRLRCVVWLAMSTLFNSNS